MKSSALCSRVVLAVLTVGLVSSCGPSPEKAREKLFALNPPVTADGDSFVKYAGQGRVDVLELLIAAGVDVSGRAREEALSYALQEGHGETVAFVLDNGVDPDVNGGRSLRIAVEREAMDMVETLLAKGADPNGEAGYAGPALSMAAAKGHIEMINTLLASGADPNLAGENGRTPLSAAVGTGWTELVELLLDKGADPWVRVSNGGLIIDNLIFSREQEMRELIVEAMQGRGLFRDRPDEAGPAPGLVLEVGAHLSEEDVSLVKWDLVLKNPTGSEIAVRLAGYEMVPPGGAAGVPFHRTTG